MSIWEKKNKLNKQKKITNKITAVQNKDEGKGNSLFLQFIFPLLKIMSKLQMTWTNQCLR